MMPLPRVRKLSLLCLLLGWMPAATSAEEQRPAEIPDSLHRYVAREEPAYGWSVERVRETPAGNVHVLTLVSQTWQDIVWRHPLLVYEPQRVDHPEHMLLFVTGGRTGREIREDEMQMGLALAKLCGARIAMLHHVPNQPLLGDHVEDDLITETWLKYLQTGDDTWPLLFPMVKSATRAMDALQEYTHETWQQDVKGFVITGASKRGWTSWLTPVADDRVIATAPIVIDTLNFPVQTQHQLDVWGKFSEQIDDYTRKGLVKTDDTPLSPREEALWKMMDPYTYRENLTLPKLIINGTNDRYWVVDALKNYWYDLEGPKFIHLVMPLQPRGGREYALRTLGVFFRFVAAGQPLPELKWEHANGNGEHRLTIRSSAQPEAARIWSATSPNRDFRESRWESAAMKTNGETFEATLNDPAPAHLALYGELQFDAGGFPYSLTTRVFQESAEAAGN